MPNPPESLFRPEALNAARSGTFGTIVLIRPLSFTLLTTLAAALAVSTCMLFWLGSYTKRSTVPGQLASDAGLIKIYAPQPGIVLERHVSEGQQVHAGDLLFVESSERSSPSEGPTQAAISDKVRQRASSLTDEIGKTKRVQVNEQRGLEGKVAGLEAELGALRAQIDSQRERAAIAEDSLKRHQELRDKDLLSGEVLMQKRAEWMDQRARLAGLERDRIDLQRQIDAARTDLTDLGLKQQNEIAQIDRQLATTSQELVESEARRRIAIIAPQSGTATAVFANVGQSIDTNRPLFSILPAGAALHAELYAPSRTMGFVRPGAPVLIRYDAFPYEKFGHHRGIVESVARTSLPAGEIGAGGGWSAPTGAEPLYRITVRLDSQSVLAYGQPQPLQNGMSLEADVMQERRRLYEWVLEPLFSLTGKL